MNLFFSVGRQAALGALAWGLLSGPVLALDFSSTFTPPVPAPVAEALHSFTLNDDAEIKIFSTLTEGATCNNSGFSITAADGVTDVVRSGFAACSPTTRSGPWALKAGSYVLKLWHNGGGGTYQARMQTVSSALAADAEPNASPAQAMYLNALGGRATGHLGYTDAVSADSVDYYQVNLPVAGGLALSLTADATLPSSGRSITVYAADGSTVVPDTSALQAGSYLVAVNADTQRVQGYGGYTLQSQFTPASASSWTLQATNLGATPRLVTLDVSLTPDAADRTAGALQLFVAGTLAGQWYFLTQDGAGLRVVPYTGGAFTPFVSLSGPELMARRFTLPLGDLSSVPGLDIYVGYGITAQDMLTRQRVHRVHQVR